MTKPVERKDLLWICRYALTDGEMFDELCDYLNIKDEEMISIADRVFDETEHDERILRKLLELLEERKRNKEGK